MGSLIVLGGESYYAVVSPYLAHGVIHSETHYLSASGRLGVQSRMVDICSDHGFGVVTLQTRMWS